MAEEQNKKFREAILAQRSLTKWEMYPSKIMEYLASKFAPFDIPEHIIMETAQFVVTETYMVITDEVDKAYRRMKRRNRRQSSQGM